MFAYRIELGCAPPRRRSPPLGLHRRLLITRRDRQGLAESGPAVQLQALAAAIGHMSGPKNAVKKAV